ncbi:ComEA family DNA-binding protein [Maribacter sp. CXY002]|uniref:ComEA family DNA-binding protein n=1 Tax=Maribacter luteocoastalis TaxID=3407671 RepID=UPI003B66D4E4
MSFIKSHFKFTKQEQSGIFYLLLLLVIIQVGYFVYNRYTSAPDPPLTLDVEKQLQVTLLKQQALKKDTLKVYPFNPNFISDYKGYTLGMSLDEIDRLHAFRATNKFVNSNEEFQLVTKISDSLLIEISPFFKFPDWIKNSATPFIKKLSHDKKEKSSTTSVITDLNSATADELQRVYGIGDKLSIRIIKFRDRLGGFLLDDQLSDVYGLDPEVAKRILKQFKVIKIPQIEKINVNSATVEELSKLVYLQKHVAQGIVDYRNINGTILSLDELTKVNDFPKDRIDRIALYLSLKK